MSHALVTVMVHPEALATDGWYFAISDQFAPFWAHDADCKDPHWDEWDEIATEADRCTYKRYANGAQSMLPGGPTNAIILPDGQWVEHVPAHRPDLRVLNQQDWNDRFRELHTAAIEQDYIPFIFDYHS